MELPDNPQDCHTLIVQLLAIISKQGSDSCAVIAALEARITELEARLNQNSRNSSKPPSSDDLHNKTRSTGLPPPSKKQGGQEGHLGKTLVKVDNPDFVISVTTSVCSCGQVLDPLTGEVIKTCQVFDLPEPKLEVTEYRVIRQVCSCGQVHVGRLPDWINGNVQYGPGVRALTVLLHNSCQLSLEKISTLIADLFGYNLNEATSVSNNDLAHKQLEPVENDIKQALIESQVVHSDESGVLVDKKLHWLHTASNGLFTLLFISLHRGAKAHEGTESILPSFKGWLIHDCWSTYFAFKNCSHGLCGSHLLRELFAQMEEGKIWAKELRQFLLDLHRNTKGGTKSVPDIDVVKQKWLQMCDRATQYEHSQHPPPNPNVKKRGRKSKPKALNLLERLTKHADAVLAFAEHDVVPFTNNQAERDVRPVKTKMKVAGCFRTIKGAQKYARIQGFISTCRKHKLNVFNELRAVCTSHISYRAPWSAK